MAVYYLLTADDLPTDLEAETLDACSGMEWVVDLATLRGLVPEERLGRLLRHASQSVATVAAIGMWEARHRENSALPSKLASAWREAVLRTPVPEHDQHVRFWLGAILANQPDLAEEWLGRRLEEGVPFYFAPVKDETVGQAIQALGTEARIRILDRLSPDNQLGLVKGLVGRNTEVYRAVLARPELESRHLDPLGGPLDEGWRKLAKLALRSGFLASEVAGHALMPEGVYEPLSYWTQRVEGFRALRSDPELVEVASIGTAEASKHHDSAALERRRWEMEGTGW
jgi:hypothetical protein